MPTQIDDPFLKEIIAKKIACNLMKLESFISLAGKIQAKENLSIDEKALVDELRTEYKALIQPNQINEAALELKINDIVKELMDRQQILRTYAESQESMQKSYNDAVTHVSSIRQEHEEALRQWQAKKNEFDANSATLQTFIYAPSKINFAEPDDFISTPTKLLVALVTGFLIIGLLTALSVFTVPIAVAFGVAGFLLVNILVSVINSAMKKKGNDENPPTTVAPKSNQHELSSTATSRISLQNNANVSHQVTQSASQQAHPAPTESTTPASSLSGCSATSFGENKSTSSLSAASLPTNIETHRVDIGA